MRSKKYHAGTYQLKAGNCWMIHDPDYSKKDHIIPSKDVKVIRFDRPCIILSENNNIVTIIPLTSKQNKHYVQYPIQIEEGRISYAIISQITTIDKARLTRFIGKIKEDVFQDIRITVNHFLLDAASVTKGIRNIPWRFNQLDIHRFYPFHIYRIPGKQYCFMALRASANDFIEIPILFPWKARKIVSSTSPHRTLCGQFYITKASDFHPIREDKYQIDMEDLGFEYHATIRRYIIQKIQEFISPHAKDILYIDHKYPISKALYTTYKESLYMYGYNLMKKIETDPNEQQVFLDKSSYCRKHRIKASVYDAIREEVLTHIHPLTCYLGCLEYLLDFMPDVLAKMLIPYESIVNLDNPSSTSFFDGSQVKERYYLKNMKWIANEIRTKHGYYEINQAMG